MDSASGVVPGLVPLGAGIDLIERKRNLFVKVVVRDPPRLPLESLKRFTRY